MRTKSKKSIVSREYFRAMAPRNAETLLQRININPDNSYKSGYERYLDYLPVIHGNDDPAKDRKLLNIEGIIKDLAENLLNQVWVFENWPAPGKMLNRVILGIDQITGGELILVRWNTIETPIHGHQYGQMIDFLVAGKAKEIEYEVSNEKARIVTEIGYSEFGNMSILSNDFHSAESNLSRGALIHRFIPLTKCITLHYIPEHPRDGRGNLFNEPK